MNQQITIHLLTKDRHSDWDAFIEQVPEATFFHKAAWQIVLERAFRHKTYFFYAEQNGTIVGVLPLAEVKSWLFGHSLVSTPFCVYGGALAWDESTKQALVDQACKLAQTLSVDYLELRNRTRQQQNWPCKELYFSFQRDISSDSDINLKAIPRKQRAVVRKSLKLGLSSGIGQDIDRFYTLYATSVRNLGTPVFSKKYFKVLNEVFAKESNILTVSKDDQPVASVMSFYFRDEVLPYYGGGTTAARRLKGNDFMYWQLMCHAAEHNYEVFDFGRSKEGTGSFSFKKNWGFEPTALYYEYYLVKAKQVPDLNPLNPKYRLMINCWKKLPLWLSQIIGPQVSKYLG